MDDVDKRVALSLEELASHVGGGAVALALDPAGRVVAASSPEWIGRRWAGRPGTAPAPPLPGARPWSPSPGAVPLLAVTSSVLAASDGALLGRIVLLVPWRSLVAEAAGGDADALAVSDAAGRPLFRGRLFLRADSAGLLVARAMADGPDAPPVQVAVAMPAAEALLPLRRTTRSLLLFAAVVLAVTLPAAVLLARSTTAEPAASHRARPRGGADGAGRLRRAGAGRPGGGAGAGRGAPVHGGSAGSGATVVVVLAADRVLVAGDLGDAGTV